MPEKMLDASSGIPKELLSKITATENDVASGKSFIGSDGSIKVGNIPDRGQWQHTEGAGSSTDESGYYIALNGIPEGIYRKNGADWAPEIRMTAAKANSLLFRRTGLLWQGFTGNQSLDIDCRSIPIWQSLTDNNFIPEIREVGNGRTDFVGKTLDSATTYSGIYLRGSYNAQTGFYHMETGPLVSYGSAYTAHTLCHWSSSTGGEGNPKEVRHLSYTLCLDAVYVWF